MPYTVYKVTNKLTGEFYIGVHKTNDPHDSYLGSGKVIRAQVALHGPENFTKEILEIFGLRREAYALEAELVAPLLGTPGCLNLHPGGHGGFGYINHRGVNNRENLTNRFRPGEPLPHGVIERRTQAWARRFQADPALQNTLRQALTKATAAWTGNHHTESTRKAISDTHKGSGNWMFGRCWIFNPSTGKSMTVLKSDLDSHIAAGWVAGRR